MAFEQIVFSFPFEVKGICVKRGEDILLHTCGGYEAVVLGDYSKGYVRYGSTKRYAVKEKIACDSYMYDVTTQFVLVLNSNYTVDSMMKKAIKDIDSFGGIISEVIMEREQIVKEERLGEIQNNLLKVIFSLKTIELADCDVELECDC